MTRGTGKLNRAGGLSNAAKMRRRIERGGERFWRVPDFPDVPGRNAARILARLTTDGELQRIRNGVYYRPRKTVIGLSTPSPSALNRLLVTAPMHPSGLSAANMLGLTTQNPARLEIATTVNNAPSVFGRAKIHTRRPTSREQLGEREGAILEVLRSRGRYSDLSPQETIDRLLPELSNGGVWQRITKVALDEPPRVRAILGALGQQLDKSDESLGRLRKTLNPLSRFDFGIFGFLPNAREWQSK